MDSAVQLGRYRLGEQIGSGGMAEVFRGDISGAEGFSRPVAIKRVRARLVGDSATARAFIEEARLAQRLQHGNVVQIHDLDIEAGVPYIVMEFVDGLSLSEVIINNRIWDHRLGVATALFIIEALADALDYAHRLSDADGNSVGVVHRDVNPRNILLSTDGIVKLTDFGIAKGMNIRPRTLPGRVKGTLGYLSPEQAYGGIIGPPTDQFATGVVLYELLAGYNPLAGASKIKEYRGMLDEGLPLLEAPDVDDELRAIVHRATASKPDARFASMSEFRQVLEAWRVARGVRTSLDGVREIVRAYRGNKPPKKIVAAKLDNAVLAQLPGMSSELGSTRMMTKSVPSKSTAASPRRKWYAIAGAVVAVMAMVVLAVAMGSGGDGTGEASAGAGAADAQVETTAAVATAPGEADAVAAAATPTVVAVDSVPVDEAKVAKAAAARDNAKAARDKAKAARDKARNRAARDRAAKDKAAKAKAAKAKAAKAKAATIQINVLPYAEVTVDGRRRGRTPVKVRVWAGPHRIRLHNPATGKTANRTVTVRDGETKRIMSW